MEYFISGIMPFTANFAPRQWAFCRGGLLAINDFQALYALTGTSFGGDGRVSFGVPDLRGRTPVGVGTGHGLSTVLRGQVIGRETHTLTYDDLPPHSHSADFHPIGGGAPGTPITAETTVKMRVAGAPNTGSPVNGYLADLSSSFGGQPITTEGYSSSGPSGTATYMASQALEATTTVTGGGGGITGGNVTIGSAGLGNDFDLRGPRLGMDYIIALNGIFPPRN